MNSFSSNGLDYSHRFSVRHLLHRLKVAGYFRIRDLEIAPKDHGMQNGMTR
jgi:hypothetical protein